MDEAPKGTDLSNDDHGLTEGQIKERELLDLHKEKIEDALGKYEDIAIFVAPKGFEDVGIVIIAAPTNPKTYQNYVNQVASDKTDKAVETVNFALVCTAYPDRVTAKAMYAKRGAFALKVAGRAQELAGSETKELGKD